MCFVLVLDLIHVNTLKKLRADDDASGSDPQMEALMRERFGPELGERRETEEQRLMSNV
jgi:hypothetical protein